VDFEAQPPVPVAVPGVHTEVGRALSDVVPFIDWGPFFQVWQLRGKYPNRGYPKIFDDETVGEQAKLLFEQAQELLTRIVDEKLFELRVRRTGRRNISAAWVCT
jgi:5-methyltetrahydrofolate--homocysteine methyltransferase